MKIFSIFFCLLFLSSIAFAQIDKAEAKQLKKEIKALKKNLSAYKKMKNESADLNRQVSQKEGEISEQQAQLTQIEQDLEGKDQAITTLEAAIEDLKNQKQEVNAANIQGRYTSKGRIFSIQIGSYVSTDLSQYMEANTNFRVENYQNPNDGQNYNRYLLGFFAGTPEGYWEAFYFTKYLINMMAESNLKYQPFVVGYEDGRFIEDIKAELPESFF